MGKKVASKRSGSGRGKKGKQGDDDDDHGAEQPLRLKIGRPARKAPRQIGEQEGSVEEEEEQHDGADYASTDPMELMESQLDPIDLVPDQYPAASPQPPGGTDAMQGVEMSSTSTMAAQVSRRDVLSGQNVRAASTLFDMHEMQARNLPLRSEFSMANIRRAGTPFGRRPTNSTISSQRPSTVPPQPFTGTMSRPPRNIQSDVLTLPRMFQPPGPHTTNRHSNANSQAHPTTGSSSASGTPGMRLNWSNAQGFRPVPNPSMLDFLGRTRPIPRNATGHGHYSTRPYSSGDMSAAPARSFTPINRPNGSFPASFSAAGGIFSGEFSASPPRLTGHSYPSPKEKGKGKEKLFENESQDKLAKPRFRISIAISGCTLSGKTTLANLLRDVFRTYEQYEMEENEAINENAWKGTKVVMVKQDRYRHPHQHCPVATWKETIRLSGPMRPGNRRGSGIPPNGSPNAGNIAIDEEQCPYPTRAECGDFSITHLPKHRVSMFGTVAEKARLRALAYQANIGIDPKLIMPDLNGNPPRGPALDCRPVQENIVVRRGPNICSRLSVEWRGFSKRLGDVKRGRDGEDDLEDSQRPGSSGAENLGKVNPRTIEWMRMQVQKFVQEAAKVNEAVGFKGRYVLEGKLREIVLIDGAILFMDPTLEEGSRKLYNIYDVMLFLPTSKATAKTRFQKQAQRENMCTEPGNPPSLCQTDGYFDGVIWQEYIREHSWLFVNKDVNMPAGPRAGMSRASAEREVWARLEMDASLSKTAVWALAQILSCFANEESKAREKFLKEKAEAGRVAIGDGFGRE